MGRLDVFIDMTGKMSQQEVLQENLKQIIDEINRASEQVDSLNNSLNIIASGSTSFSWDGTGTPAGNTPRIDLPVSVPAGFIVLAFMARSTDTPRVLYTIPFVESAPNGNNDAVMTKLFYTSATVDTNLVRLALNFYAPGTPETFTFYYFLIQQPAGVVF